jgi:Kef-type K+ transport system membrane component KefB
LVGFVVLGFFLRLANDNWTFISQHGLTVIEFLASIGVFVLLFRIGLESNLQGLLSKLPRAAPIWIGNVVLSGLPGAVRLMRTSLRNARQPRFQVAN